MGDHDQVRVVVELGMGRGAVDQRGIRHPRANPQSEQRDGPLPGAGRPGQVGQAAHRRQGAAGERDTEGIHEGEPCQLLSFGRQRGEAVPRAPLSQAVCQRSHGYGSVVGGSTAWRIAAPSRAALQF